MTTVRAAVVNDFGSEWSVENVALDDSTLGPTDVLVSMRAAGLCHTDEHIREGSLRVTPVPFVGGHEGAGVVEAVGEGVSDIAPGDHVVLCFRPSCGRCRPCAAGKAHLCVEARRLSDGTIATRFHRRSEILATQSLIGTFAEKSVVPAMSCVVIDKDIPFEVAALLGCAVPTGYGAAVNAGKVQSGDSVLIVGMGGVGTNAVQGASIAGAANIVVVDLSENRRSIATDFGATAAVETIAEASEHIRQQTGQEFDVAIITVGVSGIAENAFAALNPGGRIVLAALGDPEKLRLNYPITPIAMKNITIQGTVMGGATLRRDIPKILDLYRQSKFKLDELISEKLSLDEIQEGYEGLHRGGVTRSVIVY